jgi:hypothetical protein
VEAQEALEAHPGCSGSDSIPAMDHGLNDKAPYNLCLYSRCLCRMASFVSADHEGMIDLESVDPEGMADLESTVDQKGTADHEDMVDQKGMVDQAHMDLESMVDLEGMADQEDIPVLGWHDAHAGHWMLAKLDGTADADAYSGGHYWNAKRPRGCCGGCPSRGCCRA